MRINFLFLFLLIPLVLPAQRTPGDSLLMHERSIDRPITVHAQQVRVTGGYEISILHRRFSHTGETVNMRDEGSASVRHHYSLDIRYGITDNIQFTAALAATRHVVRHEAEYLAESEPMVFHEVENNYSGIRDLFLGVDLRAPLQTHRFDIALALGAYFPTARSASQQPDHSFRTSTRDGSAVHQYKYRYHDPPGYGIIVGSIGARMKYRTRQWAFSSGVDYRHGAKTGSGSAWRHQLASNGNYEYRKENLAYQLPDAFNYFAEIEFQASRRLDIFVHTSGFTAYDGWVSNADALKVAVPYQNITLISPGAELLLTPKLWLRESIDIAVAGKNHEAIFSLQTTLVYNFFH